MLDKCPNCGEPLVTKTIKKVLASGSIDYPISQTCPKCNWSKDLTGAGDVVSKPVTEKPLEAKKEDVIIQHAPPPKAVPPKSQPMPGPSTDINKIITVVLAILVLGGLAWAFFLYPGAPTKQGGNIPTPTPTPVITQTQVQTPTVTTIPEVTPTGNKTLVKLDSRRGFIPNKQTTKPGDELIWRNTGTETLTLVSSDGLFDAQLLANDKEFRYISKKTGTYNFYLKGNTNLNGTIVVEP
jgi:plastocyanin